MKTDTLNRRSRFSGPDLTAERLSPTEADFLVGAAIDRHGYLPTHYLYEFSKHIRKEYTYVQKRLTDLFHGDTHGPLLTRPQPQFNAYEARYQHIVYGNAPRMKQELSIRDRLGIYSPSPSNDFVHDLMRACVMASIEIGAPAKGLDFIHREMIIRTKCPNTTRTQKTPLALPLEGHERKAIIPDDLFCLKYADGGTRYFALEIDRNTETLTTFAKKIAAYSRVLDSELYKSWWGIPNLHILIVTTNPGHMRNLMALVREHTDPKWISRFKFACEPRFGTRRAGEHDGHWRVPKTLITHLLDEQWETAVGPRDITTV